MVNAIGAAVLVCVVAQLARPTTGRQHAPALPRAPHRLGGGRHRVRRRRRPPDARAVADWCDEIARRLRSGSTMRDALTGAIPADEAVRTATEPFRLAVSRGAVVAEAAAVRHDPGPHLRIAFTVIATTARLGGSPVEAIDRAASVLRLRAADRDDRAMQAAQARLSAHVLTAVPLAMLAVLVVTDPDVRAATASPTGMACVGTGLALNALGWWWMRRIVRPRR